MNCWRVGVPPVFAFYNGEIGHYFITAGIAERDSLVGGGGGWYLVDEGFNAWPAGGPAPTAAKPVCRFYSAAVNSHFYTAGPNECESLKQPSSGWTYEGIAFRALVPRPGVPVTPAPPRCGGSTTTASPKPTAITVFWRARTPTGT